MTGDGNGQYAGGGWNGYAPGPAPMAPTAAAQPTVPALPAPHGMTQPAARARAAPMVAPSGNIMSEGGAPAAPDAPVPGLVMRGAAPAGYGPAMMPQMMPAAPTAPFGLVPPTEGSHMLGLATLAVGAGTMIGLKLGGVWGGLAGSLVGGAAVNAYRALHYYKEGTAEGDKEARVAATYAVLTTAVGGYLFATKAKAPEPGPEAGEPMAANPDEDDEDDEDERAERSALEPPALPPARSAQQDEGPYSESPCGMRPAGP